MDSTGTTAIFATTTAPIWFQIKPEILYLCPSNSFPKLSNIRNPRLRIKSTTLFLLRCSTKPDTDRAENVTDENLSAEASSNSRIQEQEVSAATSQGISESSAFSRGLVFGLGSKDSWDGAEIGSPVVKRYLSDEEERWYMWYHGSSRGNPSMDSIGLAVSSNGIHWERGEGAIKSSNDVGLTMKCSTDWWAFDTQGIRPCEVVIMSSAKVRANNSLYWLYYTGCNGEEIERRDSSPEVHLNNPERLNFGGDGGGGRIYKSLPGLAMSQDGRHWARIEGEHHSGALFDVGSEGEWDSLFIASPQVVYHGAGDMRMYYHSFDAEKGQYNVGIARSRDGMKWVKLGKITMVGGGGSNSKGMFDELGVMNACVVRNRKDGKYVMAYEGVAAAGGRRSIGISISSDGLKQWRRVGDGPVLKQCEEDGWDCEGVGSPCLVQMDAVDEWRVYYRGFDKVGNTGIGLAVSLSHGSEFSEFQRWTGFHL